MTKNDIYNSQKKYENFKKNLTNFASLPTNKKARYYYKNPQNLNYFRQLFPSFEAKDNSYSRRIRLLNSLKLICYSTEKDLKDCERDDINSIVAYMHSVSPSPKTKQDFIRDIKFLWKTLFSETDKKGRLDETLVPYPVRHLSAKIDKSKEKLRRNNTIPCPNTYDWPLGNCQ